MKNAILILVLSTIYAPAQFVAVTFNSISSGAPTNLWTECVYQSTTNIHGVQVLFTTENFNTYMATNMASFYAWQTNSANPEFQIKLDVAVLQSRLATNNLDRLNMQTNVLSNADLNKVVFNLLRTMHKLENLLQDQYKNNPQDAGQ